jgi:1-acyl-sn-glycerol-3-phosphate acyltransferase
MTTVRNVGDSLRRLWYLTVWRMAIAMWCRRFAIEDRRRIPDGPVLIVANHASHADTVVLQFALASGHRHPLRVAGAEDYWFRNRMLGYFARVLGIFAFPRRGETGVQRTREVLGQRMSVLIFPQGTRGGGRFRAGIGRIASSSGAPVVPVHVSGTDTVLPRGSRWPRRGDVVVRVGAPVAIGAFETPEEFAARLEHIVQADLARAA